MGWPVDHVCPGCGRWFQCDVDDDEPDDDGDDDAYDEAITQEAKEATP